MRKLIFIFSILILFSASVFGVTRKQGSNGVKVDWLFTPKVSTNVGFNIDFKSFGIEGKASFQAKTVIRKKANEEFVSDNADKIYAKIEVKDLEMKIDSGTVLQGNKKKVSIDPDANNNSVDYIIALGDINGTIYLGPAYIKLASRGNEKVDYINAFVNSSINVVERDIIAPDYTGRRQGTDAKNYLIENNSSYVGSKLKGDVGYDPDTASQELDTLTVDNNVLSLTPTYKVGDNLASFGVGFKLDKIIDVRVDLMTTYSFRSNIPYAYNPMALSISMELLAVDNLTLAVKAGFIWSPSSKPSEFISGITSDNGTPISFGFKAGYDVLIGDFKLTPYLGLDMAFLKLNILDAVLGLTNNPGAFIYNKDGEARITGIPVELGVGVKFTWAGKGVKEANQDLFGKKDTDVSDGVALGVIYGRTPNQVLRSINTSYIGAKISFWESEDKDKPGIIPGLQAAFVLNANYALGGTYTDNISGISSNGSALTKIKTSPFFDLGVGFDVSYRVSFVRPRIGMIAKWFNVMNEVKSVIFERDGADNIEVAVNEPNKYDLRLKIGVDIIDVIPNTVFDLYWVSGDLLKTSTKVDPEGYSTEAERNSHDANQSKDFFSSDAGESSAYLGYITLGATIKF